jgi:hypothetical protein
MGKAKLTLGHRPSSPGCGFPTCLVPRPPNNLQEFGGEVMGEAGFAVIPGEPGPWQRPPLPRVPADGRRRAGCERHS